MRAIPSDMNAGIVAEVDNLLDGIEREHGVAIPWAIESGSRAWGFPSPDSDFDCRFVYLRAPAAYQRLFPPRDVIETPLTPVLDVNGWDLAKAVKLMLTGNAVIVEWLTSPIIYRGDPAFRDAFLEFGARVLQRDRVARHYLHLGRRMRQTVIADPAAAPLKKVFYALRPAVALRWLRLHPEAAIAPMHFPTLCREAELPFDAEAEIGALIARKAVTRELGSGPLPAGILSLIEAELSDDEVETEPAPDPSRNAEAEAFFARMLAAWAPSEAPR